jgi:hypothetical protein
MIKIGVFNASKRITGSQFHLMVAAVILQMARDFCPAWSLTVQVTPYADRRHVPEGTVPAGIFDKSDAPDALGYHSENQGKPFINVFTDPVFAAGGNALGDFRNPKLPCVASVLSHEVMETAADLHCVDYDTGPERAEGSLYAKEVADPVQGDGYAVKPGDQQVVVSDFVTPAWFDPQADKDERFNFLGTVKAPFALAPGGYCIIRDGEGQESAVFGDAVPEAEKDDRLARLMAKLGRVAKRVAIAAAHRAELATAPQVVAQKPANVEAPAA